eukprot:CAMPEP_0184967690 /NCGR_PEP_ID=MMETSP1098-20130426/968_1 /TAXON_ID=89044 /ORGANISM="Spumella elongata, Strain CCAP 955/1" /LENGTH=287 /DNA_ID=CAMNT_0027489177 /DNA_START=32 /DNA_END=895 /DNA_ORIENTATION=-
MDEDLNNVRSSNAWSHTSKAFSSESMVQIFTHFAKFAAGMLLKDVPADGSVRFLDIAAGAGALAGEVLNALSEQQKSKAVFDITDFSPGMVETSVFEIAKLDLENRVTKTFQVMDGQALEFPDNTFSHVGCQFGIMFYPNRQKGLSEMHRVLQLGGTAVILTWHYNDNLQLLLDFSSYLNISHLESSIATMNDILSACGQPAQFEAELAAVGFRDITVTKVEKVFDFADSEEFYLDYASNPAMSAFMGGECKFKEWEEFLRTVGRRWLNKEGRLCLKFVANIAVARK